MTASSTFDGLGASLEHAVARNPARTGPIQSSILSDADAAFRRSASPRSRRRR